MADNEYVFRYPLSADQGTPVYQDPLLEMTRRQWEALLDVAIPVCGGQEVRVDGFKLLRDRNTVYPIHPGDPRLGDEPLPGVRHRSPFDKLRASGLECPYDPAHGEPVEP